MTDTVLSYLLFLAETITLVAAILMVVAGLIAIIQKSKKHQEGELEIISLNEQYEAMHKALQSALLPKDDFKKWIKALKKQTKSATQKPRIFVLNFDGNIKASEVDSLRHCITAILTIATPEDKVFIRLESPGGMVHAYGLAASQLQRIKDKNIPLIAAVDKVAASGGYLMAAVANTILAAPFAVVGSIGVVAQIPNFYRALKNLNIDFEQLTAGEYKRTLTLFGKNTDQGRQKMQEELEETHRLFKQFVAEHRPQLNIEQVATGEHWYGQRAKELNLINEIKTSDDYLLEASKTADLFEVEYFTKQSLSDKLTSWIGSMTRFGIG